MTGSDGIVVRRAQPSDDDAVLELMATSLGWSGDQPFAALFRWKHLDNAFGRSPAWVAEADGRLAGFRTFMRWRFLRGGEPIAAVRAVDTATHPDFRGRGIFTSLTMQALEALRADGVAFVFNTPNDQSRPGYLKMGWQPVGRLPLRAWFRGPASLLNAGRARAAAELWSQPCRVGLPVPTVAAELAATVPDARGLATDRPESYWCWRYGFEPLHYRCLVADGGPMSGFLVFRLRRRGSALEAAVAELHGPAPMQVRLLRRLLRSTQADYAVSVSRRTAHGVPLPGQGPLLTWRALTETRQPTLGDWRLSLGDVELF